MTDDHGLDVVTHSWVQDRCELCGLRREEAWFLDESGEPIMALVWTYPNGRMRIRPFPRLLGLKPPAEPAMTVEQALPRVPVGKEPVCESARWT